MATNNTNAKLIAYAGDINTAPDKFTTLTGTMTVNGIFVLGAGSLFLTEIDGILSPVGQPSKVEQDGWLFNGVDEVRQIEEVIDNTHLVLKSPFTLNIVAGRTIRYVRPSRTKQMSFVLISGTVMVDNVALAVGEGSGWGDTAPRNIRTIEPIVVDSSGGVVHFSRYTAN